MCISFEYYLSARNIDFNFLLIIESGIIKYYINNNPHKPIDYEKAIICNFKYRFSICIY